MRPKHECLPFGGPHRHGIHYSTRTPRKAPDRAKITQEKKIAPEPIRPSDISTLIDTRKRGERARRGEPRQKEIAPPTHLGKRSDKKRDTTRIARVGAPCQSTSKNTTTSPA